MYVCKRYDGWYVMSNDGSPEYGPVQLRSQAEAVMRQGALLFLRMRQSSQQEEQFILHRGMLEKVGRDGFRQLARAVGDDVVDDD